jgi:hypothetical protein
MRCPPIRSAAILLTLAVAASCSADADGAATTSEARTAPSTTQAAPPPTAAPVEFTACVNPGPQVQNGTNEVSPVALPEGEMAIEQRRGYTWQSEVRDVSDPRLVGTWYNSVDSDEYSSPGVGPGPGFEAWTHRIENDDGAWQGSLLEIDFPDGESVDESFTLIGEGGYEASPRSPLSASARHARTCGDTSSTATFLRHQRPTPADSEPVLGRPVLPDQFGQPGIGRRQHNRSCCDEVSGEDLHSRQHRVMAPRKLNRDVGQMDDSQKLHFLPVHKPGQGLPTGTP